MAPFVSIPEISISTRFFWTRLVRIFLGIFSNVVLWRKVFCKHVLQIKFIDPLLTFSKNSGNVFIDLLMVLLWLFFCKYFFTTGWTFLRFVLDKMYGIWGLQTKELYSVVNFTLVDNPQTMNFLAMKKTCSTTHRFSAYRLIWGTNESVSFVSLSWRRPMFYFWFSCSHLWGFLILYQ